MWSNVFVIEILQQYSTLLEYNIVVFNNFVKTFEILFNASDYQLGYMLVTTQKEKSY